MYHDKQLLAAQRAHAIACVLVPVLVMLVGVAFKSTVLHLE